jgi:hypothetical protein
VCVCVCVCVSGLHVVLRTVETLSSLLPMDHKNLNLLFNSVALSLSLSHTHATPPKFLLPPTTPQSHTCQTNKTIYTTTLLLLLRRKYTVERPYRIPLNTVGCALFVTPPCIFLFYLMTVASRMTYIYVGVLCVMGVLFQFMQKIVKHYDLVEYVEAPTSR